MANSYSSPTPKPHESSGYPGHDGIVCHGAIVLDRGQVRVWRGGEEVRLTLAEFRLLECLLERPGYVFSRRELLDLVWGHDKDVSDRAVDAAMVRLRRRLNWPGAPDTIRTVRGVGYALDGVEAGGG